MVIGYIACFLSGAAVCLSAVFLCRKFMVEPPQKTETPQVRDERAEKLREQWANLLNSDGSDQKGVIEVEKKKDSVELIETSIWK